MTTPIHQTLRVMHAAIQPLGFLSDSGAEVYHLSGERQKFLVLLAAADALECRAGLVSDLRAALGDKSGLMMQDELLDHARKCWHALLEDKTLDEIRAEGEANVMEKLREAATAELANWQASGHNSPAAAAAILALCEKLGVSL